MVANGLREIGVLVHALCSRGSFGLLLKGEINGVCLGRMRSISADWGGIREIFCDTILIRKICENWLTEMKAKKISIRKFNVIFNCSPSLGIIDSWMPIMSSLRENLPGANFIFVAPNLRTVQELDLSSWLHQKTSRIFDQIVFKDSSDQWYSFGSFDAAIKVARKLDSWVVTRVFRKIRLGVIESYLIFFQHWISKRRFQESCFEFRAIENQPGVLLFDLHEVEKPYTAYIKEHFSGVEKYSLYHGISVRGIGDFKSGISEPVSLPGLVKYNVLLFSQEELKFYREKYGLVDNNLRVIGIPRHEAQWLTGLEKVHGDVDFDKVKRFIFVIGRPSNEKYFPRKRKLQALQDICDVAEENGLDIIVKKHPKENDDATYQKVFTEMSRGLTFSFSKSHPLVLGRHCVFAVSFFSGVAVDMVRLGTPVIERLDLRGLPFSDNEDALRDDNNDPVYVYRYLGLALGANDSLMFAHQVRRVMKCRDEVVAEQQAAYDRVYPTIPNINEKIASEITRAVLE